MRHLIALMCISFFAANCRGDIVINISEAAGGTHITASGSVISQFAGSGGLPGLFFGDSLGGSAFISIPTNLGDFGILSGSGVINGETITGTSAYVGDFSIRSTGLISINPGSVISISADFISAQTFSNFIPGSYSGSNLGGIPVEGLITMNITAVPEPSSLLLVAGSASVVLLHFRRRKPTAQPGIEPGYRSSESQLSPN